MEGALAARSNGVYKTIKDRLAAAGKSDSIVQTGSFLRMHAAAVNGQSTYSFSIQKNSAGVQAVHERRLDQNDAFVATKLGFFLMAENPVNPGVGVLQTYPNVITFPAEAGNVTNAHLEAFWNGSMYLKVDDKVRSDAWLLSNCRKVGTAQEQAAGGASTATYGPTAKSERLPWDGFVDVAPMITFDGLRKTEIILNVPSFNGQQVQYVTAPAKTTLVLMFYGFLATGASNAGLLDLNNQ